MATSLLRLKVVRTADAQNDQKTPLEITGAPTTPVTQEEFQELLLSQIKRIIFGSATGNWYSNFGSLGVESLAQLSAILASRVVGESLAGSINGTNTVFTTASKFVHVVGGLSIQVYMNGQLKSAALADGWLETSPASGSFDFKVAPQVGDIVQVFYWSTTPLAAAPIAQGLVGTLRAQNPLRASLAAPSIQGRVALEASGLVGRVHTMTVQCRVSEAYPLLGTLIAVPLARGHDEHSQAPLPLP